MEQLYINSQDLRKAISEYLSAAAYSGKEIVITRRGKPICRLIALDKNKKYDEKNK